MSGSQRVDTINYGTRLYTGTSHRQYVGTELDQYILSIYCRPCGAKNANFTKF